MRGNKVQGRFKIDFENKSMEEGVTDELRDPVGSIVSWYQWDEQALQDDYENWVDPIYDVSNEGEGLGLAWKDPIEVPVIMAQQIRGTNVMNERGLYTTDTLRLVIGVNDVNRLIPDVLTNPNLHIQDRIVFQDTVFVPTRVLPRGSFGYRWAVITIDCNQMNPEELVNDPQFQNYASPSKADARTIGYGAGSYGSDPYGE